LSNLHPHKTAVLLFTRTPEEEIVHKSLIPTSTEKSLRVVAQSIQYVQQEVRKANLPLYTAYSTHQQGNSFGERLANEVEKVFLKGYEHVIILGNDCLQVTATLLKQAVYRGEQGKNVVGPAKDGGLYLIHFHKKQFDKQQFEELPWETASLYDAFLNYLTPNSAIQLLRVFEDIDHAAQLLAITVKLTAGHLLKEWFLKLFNPPVRWLEMGIAPFAQLHLFLPRQLRAPPTV